MKALFIRNTKRETPNSRNTSFDITKQHTKSYMALRRKSLHNKLTHFQNLLLRGMEIQRYLDKPLRITGSYKNLGRIELRSKRHVSSITGVPFIPNLFPVDNLPLMKERRVEDLWRGEEPKKYNAIVLEDILRRRNSRMNILYKKIGLHSRFVKDKCFNTEDKLKGIIYSIKLIGKPSLKSRQSKYLPVDHINLSQH